MDKRSKAYLVGGGIASLSAAVHLIKDAKISGENITIFDESKKIGGSLDAQDLSVSDGYVMRGIRMFEEKAYTCTFDLMSQIPSLNAPGKTIRQEFVDFNRENRSYSKSRLLKDGQAINSRPLGLSAKDRLNLLSLLSWRESSLDNLEIRDYFTPAFFTSNFWYEFCTVFAFEAWHSLIEFRRYIIRFIQDFPNLDTLASIETSPYNQYEFLVLPIVKWLQKQGVKFVLNTKITNLEFKFGQKHKTVTRIYYDRAGDRGYIKIGDDDYVFTTLGSIVANSSLGSMHKAPVLNDKPSAAWSLWEKIAENRPEFGRPTVFDTHLEKSKWISFTVTFRDPTFFNLIEKFIDKKVNTYGGVNLIESNWLISIVLSYKPYFLNQPAGINLCWGYGLFCRKPPGCEPRNGPFGRICMDHRFLRFAEGRSFQGDLRGGFRGKHDGWDRQDPCIHLYQQRQGIPRLLL